MPEDKKPITLYDKLMTGGVFGQVFQPYGCSWKYVVVGLAEGYSLNAVSLAIVDPSRFQEFLDASTPQFPFPSFARDLPLVRHDQDLWQGPAQPERSSESSLVQTASADEGDYGPAGQHPNIKDDPAPHPFKKY